jgi:RNA polymerase sigma-70 factor (sigma-E family)
MVTSSTSTGSSRRPDDRPPTDQPLSEPAVPVQPGIPEIESDRGPDPISKRDIALTALFDAHHTQLMRLAALLGADDAEDIASEAFYRLYRRWEKLREPAAALSYLRATVCNLVRQRLRHLGVAHRHEEPPNQHHRSAETEVILREDQRAIAVALRRLPTRQREAVVLRYWLDLKEVEVAAAMGISCGAVKSHTARAMAALGKAMETDR